MTDAPDAPAVPSAPAAPPQGVIRLGLHEDGLRTVLTTPYVHVSGHEVVARYGTTDVPVWAGRNRVDVHVAFLSHYGHASLEVDVAPGAVVPVFYAAPRSPRRPGLIGLTPQEVDGSVVAVGIAAGLTIAVCLVVYGALLLAF